MQEIKTFQLRLLLRNCGKEIFKFKVKDYVKPDTLETFLQDFIKKQRLEILKDDQVITPEQYDLLCPVSGNVSIDDFDFTLLLVILRTFCCSIPCDDPLWYKGKEPEANDLSTEADIVRVRNYKHKLEQIQSPLSEENFQAYWDELCQIFRRLGSDVSDLEELFDTTKQASYDDDLEKELLNDFTTWHQMEQKFESGLDLTITESKSLKCRVYSLIVDGGTRVFRNYFDGRVPPSQLPTTLSNNRAVLARLKNRGIITVSQDAQLHPSSGRPSSATFDITLLAILLRNFCGFNSHDPVWSPQTPPSPTDRTPQADISRIRDYRNKLLHLPQTGNLTEDEFNSIWNDITQILVRLNDACANPFENLVEELNALKTETVDPGRVEELERVLKEWIEMDEKYESKIIKTILENSVMEGEVERSKQTVKDVIADEFFEKTTQYVEAKRKLDENFIIVLNGAPGEGKTTVAKKLLAEVSKSERYIQLHSYTDWDKITNFDNIDIILIDDMFGSGIFDKEEYRKWSKHIPTIAAAVKSKQLYVVITSRSYILTEAVEKMYVKNFFTQEHILTLDSRKLSQTEKENILKRQFSQAAERDDSQDDSVGRITVCENHTQIIQEITELEFCDPECSLTIGFPECARLFSNNQSLYNEGVTFFKRPMSCVKTVMSKLLDEKETFIAFFVLWAQKTKQLTSINLECPIDETSVEITEPIRKLQFRPEDYIMEIRHCLKKHRGGFINFEPLSETFSFSHRVVQDAVGLVSYDKNPTATIGHFDKPFIETYIHVHTNMKCVSIPVGCHSTVNHCYLRQGNTESSAVHDTTKSHIDSPDSIVTRTQCPETVLYLSNARYSQLCSRIGTLILPDDYASPYDVRVWVRPALYGIAKYIEPSIFKNEIFSNENFCEIFLDTMRRRNLLNYVLTTPFRTIQTEFAEFRFLKRTDTEIRLPSYLIWIKEAICPMTEMVFNVLKKELNMFFHKELHIALLIAVNLGSQKLVKYLFEKGAKIEVNHLSVAIMKEDNALLSVLLEKSETLSQNLLLQICKVGYVEVVSMLLQKDVYKRHLRSHGTVIMRNAVEKGHSELVKLLLQTDKDMANSKFMLKSGDTGSLFHFVVLQQNISLVEVLLDAGIRPVELDSCGRTPFLFAISCNYIKDIERLLEISEEDGVQCHPDRGNNTPLCACILRCSLSLDSYIGKKVFKLAIKLCKYKENINLRNAKGESAMKLACKYGLTDVVNEIICKHEDPMKENGTTLFHHFVTTDNLDSIRTLLKSTIDPNLHDKSGRTPFMLANSLGKKNVVRVLQENMQIVKYNKEMGIMMMNMDSERRFQRQYGHYDRYHPFSQSRASERSQYQRRRTFEDPSDSDDLSDL